MIKLKKLENIIVVSFTGPRPYKLTPYPFSMESIKQNLYNTNEKLIIQKGATTFISGGALGFDQYAFESILLLQKKYPHIQNIMAVPFEEQYKKDWDESQVKLYMQYKKAATEVVYIDEIQAYQKGNKVEIGKYQGSKYQRRNEYMVDNSQLLISLYDGNKSSGTYNCIDYAKRKNVPILNLDLKNQLKYQLL
ncbi:hypothetical protein CN918_25765 [Priestia megaterium]|nr:hypothetical protein CN918_25765 [Priestia megaterium]